MTGSILYVGNDPNDLVLPMLRRANGFLYEQVGNVYTAIDAIRKRDYNGVFLASLRLSPIEDSTNLVKGGFDVIEAARSRNIPVVVRTGSVEERVHNRLAKLNVRVLPAPNNFKMIVPTVLNTFGSKVA